ncbi:DNA-binding transcriptional regulator, GntR family [Micromonospora pattaloongensis]|uniref:DNA-binding transcriptional regulator, GntR family n=1 Tax=Micromonospora pattaloongensis TaxID=405436 RepID=A0A1H3FM20_9ACTN|nr:GntR family transcriptional regulator [Micromonospora pattaloongensis]SDX91980.1 DNA-binding transcriptional regulator, GntR family [Micromonospora pattaloongensis]
MRPARRLTLTDDVYESVRALIMDHAVAPGERVNIDALARQLQVSPTPVREALARLESDGLVRKRPLAGYTAAPLLTRAEFEELVEMRLVLETAAARRCATRTAAREGADGVDVAALRREADLPGPTADSGYAGIAAFTARDARFHNLLAEFSGNRMLHEAVVRLRPHLHLFRLHFPTTHHDTSAREHHRVVDAVAAGDPDGADAAMRAHLLAARERHLPYFTEEG